eukprot:CAMPEP_0113516302 /NCGR_PEP_ID=MMETSP0014_2-20120614/41475_1 /TAXON_ID=2857 /ORGANISM="Nitzschia sp." /LENGTH=47 /DNA_ID=CAMNT_0000413067 /DNA_START=355 /DNA_END=498 /DNA_ORIENTATION=+ /assembly_acc=CAM_ASM_000159
MAVMVLATTAGLKTECGFCHGLKPETYGISGIMIGRPSRSNKSISGT